jgi:TonB family protein
VKVLFKPRPRYTDDARRRKVQGDVVLEVEFQTSGHVRVIRVLQSLDTQLDEAAARAAEDIRFAPATSAGQPVDVRATVHGVFRIDTR